MEKGMSRYSEDLGISICKFSWLTRPGAVSGAIFSLLILYLGWDTLAGDVYDNWCRGS